MKYFFLISNMLFDAFSFCMVSVSTKFFFLIKLFYVLYRIEPIFIYLEVFVFPILIAVSP